MKGRLRQAEPFGPGGVGGVREPRLRGLGYAEKGALRPWFLDYCPVAKRCLNLKLRIL